MSLESDTGRVFGAPRAAVFILLAVSVLLALGERAWSQVPSSRPGADLVPIHGMSYQPAPSDYSPCQSCPYYDSDFANADFAGLWGRAGGGRGDLHAVASELGVNFLHLYDWNPARDHLPFLNESHTNRIKVAVPISNYFVRDDPDRAKHIEDIVREVYVDERGEPSITPHPSAAMWTIGNEYDLSQISAQQVSQATASIVAAERKIGATRLLPVSVPVSFAAPGGTLPAVSATQAVMQAFRNQPELGRDFVSSRFIAATNPQNRGEFIKTWLPAFKRAVPDTPVWFSEMGTGVLLSCAGEPTGCTPSEDQQARFNADQFRSAQPGAEGILLGGARFEFENELWKGDPSTTNDATFGVYKYAADNNPARLPTTGGSYLIDELATKPSWTALRDAFKGRLMLSAAPPAGTGIARVSGGKLRFADEDIVAYDRRTATWSLVFDGSDAGLRRNAIDAFTLARDGDVLLSLHSPQRVGGREDARAAVPPAVARVGGRDGGVGRGGRGQRDRGGTGRDDERDQQEAGEADRAEGSKADRPAAGEEDRSVRDRQACLLTVRGAGEDGHQRRHRDDRAQRELGHDG